MIHTLALVAWAALAGMAAGQQAKPVAPQPEKPAAVQPPAPATPAPPVAQASGQQPQAATAEKPAPGGYSYNPEGRRDPFVSYLQRGDEGKGNPANRPPGLPGVSINEVTVKGILKDPSGYIAMIEAPDKKTYIVRSGQKLLDGSIKSITADTVVFSQDVSDPLSLVKQREVRKAVRSTDRG